MNDIQNVLKVGSSTRSSPDDGESVTAVTIAVDELDIFCWATKRQAIISVIDSVLLE